jgi:predicted 2-oxoglutarate/Fe(II)-dependent dioxygenase YbiX
MPQKNLKDFIKIYDNVLEINFVSKIVKYLSKLEKPAFRKGFVLNRNKGSELNTNHRIVDTFHLDRASKSLTEVFFYNYIRERILNFLWNDYVKEIPMCSTQRIEEITILKYEKGGKYNYHIDHNSNMPRTVSVIIFLNNDYKGGELSFLLGDEEYIVNVKPGRMVIWPSNYLYPHKVHEVSEGIRYSIVSWLL